MPETPGKKTGGGFAIDLKKKIQYTTSTFYAVGWGLGGICEVPIYMKTHSMIH